VRKENAEFYRGDFVDTKIQDETNGVIVGVNWRIGNLERTLNVATGPPGMRNQPQSLGSFLGFLLDGRTLAVRCSAPRALFPLTRR
jgi:hypothetical protein